MAKFWQADFRFEFKSMKGDEYRIDIIDITTTFPSDPIFTAYTPKVSEEGFRLLYEGENDFYDGGLVGSKVTVQCYPENDTQFNALKDIINDPSGKYKMAVYRKRTNDNDFLKYWIGTIISELFQYSDEAYPRRVEVAAVDDIARLKDLQWWPTQNIQNLQDTLMMLLSYRVQTKQAVWDGEYWNCGNWWDDNEDFMWAKTTLYNSYVSSNHRYRTLEAVFHPYFNVTFRPSYVQFDSQIGYANWFDYMNAMLKSLCIRVFQSFGRYWVRQIDYDVEVPTNQTSEVFDWTGKHIRVQGAFSSERILGTDFERLGGGQFTSRGQFTQVSVDYVKLRNQAKPDQVAVGTVEDGSGGTYSGQRVYETECIFGQGEVGTNLGNGFSIRDRVYWLIDGNNGTPSPPSGGGLVNSLQDNWARKSTESTTTLQEMRAKILTSLYRNDMEMFKGSVVVLGSSYMDFFVSLVMDSEQWFPLGIELIAGRNEWQGEWVKLEYDDTDVTIAVKNY